MISAVTTDLLSKIANFNVTTKILLVVFVIVFTYVIANLGLSPFLAHQPDSWQDMMGHMTGFNQPSITLNLISLSLALGVGVITSIFLHSPSVDDSKVNSLEIIRTALSDDENIVIAEIQRAGEITQDSLRFRLEWSKAKISRILTNLDRMNLIQRRRTGKTYMVFLSSGKRRSEA